MIQVNNLTKIFGKVKAVDNLSFNAQTGEIFGLLGPNGAGKTTTIRLLSTIICPSSGSASIAGFDIRKQPEEVRKKIGVLTTDIGHYDRFSARENLQYFANLYGLDQKQTKQRIEELSKLLRMESFLDKKAGKCSTGMRQKIALARSIIHDPPIFILDEPTSGLDVLASQTVLDFIHEASINGKTIILSTHNMTLAQKLCRRICIIHQGRKVFEGLTSELLNKTREKLLEDAFLQLVNSQS